MTHVVFRHVVSKAGRPDVFFTEFANTESYCHPEGNHSVRGRLLFTEDEQPMVAHIRGDKPEFFAKMSIDMAKLGFRPEVAAEIIQAAKAGGFPVSVKTRLGFHQVDELKLKRFAIVWHRRPCLRLMAIFRTGKRA